MAPRDDALLLAAALFIVFRVATLDLDTYDASKRLERDATAGRHDGTFSSTVLSFRSSWGTVVGWLQFSEIFVELIVLIVACSIPTLMLI